ncbi:N-acetylglutamate synthase [Sinorhizobium sp. CCBAU 05631]|nr:N-acetylglutamate synthase [Sinorhizobium sp. CCBAU 05631]
MIIGKTERLIIRNWREGDRDLFAEINSDPKVMEFFPFRRDRAAADALFDRNARHHRRDGLRLLRACAARRRRADRLLWAGPHPS